METQTARRNKIGRGRRGIHMLREVKRVVNKGVKPEIQPKQGIRPSEILRRDLIRTKRKGRCLKDSVYPEKFCTGIRTMAMPPTTALG